MGTHRRFRASLPVDGSCREPVTKFQISVERMDGVVWVASRQDPAITRSSCGRLPERRPRSGKINSRVSCRNSCVRRAIANKIPLARAARAVTIPYATSRNWAISRELIWRLNEVSKSCNSLLSCSKGKVHVKIFFNASPSRFFFFFKLLSPFVFSCDLYLCYIHKIFFPHKLKRYRTYKNT